MRTLGEIITACKDGQKPSVDELRYAVCAMDGLSTFDSTALMRLAEAEQDGKKPVLTTSSQWQWKESFDRWKRALAMSPKDYLGENYDPDSPEVQKRRTASKKIWDRISH